ncbi:flavin reductase family protein [Magnetospirillum sp. UT-4]|uniref:flavin reductase family protein n=1 Tax=Magnetospirillum sp. UT-4 TaxID=2681467 RepID=UPI00137DB2C4|nr:flavin reductase family protein [Magnetospirillum sp. UT-4]CAA7617732.1 Flavin-dependent monooxygenase, reductase subunit HsaB [Magnetospirillum sp. UT-4]
MSVDQRTFRKALGCFATGVTVVTAIHPETKALAGVTVSAFSSLSLQPPLVLFCLGHQTSSLDAFVKAGRFAVNILAESQRDLSNRFASRAADKWNGVQWEAWDSGAPILAGCIANLECSVVTTHQGGDHIIFVGHVDRLRQQEGGAPLVYFRGGYVDYAPPSA